MIGPDAVGLIGVALVLLAYVLVAAARWSSRQPRYQILNLAGTTLVLYSLIYAWNLPAAILQVLWILFSAIGLWRYYYPRGRS